MSSSKGSKFVWRNDIFNGNSQDHSNLLVMPNDPSTKFVMFFKRATPLADSTLGISLNGSDGSEKHMQVKIWLEDDKGQKFCRQQASKFKFSQIGDRCSFLLQKENADKMFSVYENGGLNWTKRIISFCCKLTQIVQPVKLNITSKPLERLRKNLWDMYQDGQEWDFLIKAGEKEFKVHRIILLAQSPMIKRMLSIDCEEKKSSTLEIKDSSALIVEEFVNWFYRGSISTDFDSIEELFAIADEYGVDELKNECLKQMAETLADDNSGRRLVIAVKHNQENFRDYILSVIAKKKPASHLSLLQSDEWIELTIEHKKLAKEVVNVFRSKVQ